LASSHNLTFIHGWGSSCVVWRHQIEHFSKEYSAEALDLPGHGTRPPLDSYTFDSLANSLSTIINPQAMNILIGSSYGGMLAIEMVHRQPKKFKALVLAGCNSKFSDGINPVVIKNLIRNLNRNFEATMRNCYGLFFSNKEDHARKAFLNEQALPDKKATIDILGQLMTLDLNEKLKHIKIPTLIMHGDKDEVCPINTGQALHKDIKDSRFEVFKDGGHLPFYTQPQDFNRILEDFIVNVK